MAIRKIITLFSPEELRRSFLLLIMVMVMAFIDAIGIASIMPFIAVLGNQDIIQNNQILHWVYLFLDFKEISGFLIFLGSVVFLTLVASITFKAITTRVLFRFTHMMEFSLGARLVYGYFNQPYEWFLNRNSSDLGKNVLSELQKVLNCIFLPIMQLVAHGAIVLALMILLVMVEPKLAIVTGLFLSSAYWAVYSILQRRLKRMGTEQLNANSDRFASLSEGFGGIKDVKMGSLESVFINRFSIAAKLNAELGAKVQVYAQLPKFLMEIMVFGGMLLLLLYKINTSGSFSASLPTIALFALAGYRLMPSLQQIYYAITMLRFSMPVLDLIYKEVQQLEIVNRQLSIQTEPVKQLIFVESVQFNSVSYRYPNQLQFALKDVDLLIKPRSSVAFVGKTGSGKSTAVDVLLGMLLPQQGCVRIDGIPLTLKNQRSWGACIGYVPQSIYLCDDTIEANIAFGINPENVDYAAVIRAAKIAQLHEFVISELPTGYKTKVGERGVRLSGGQRQRIGLARALYKMPSVLILDEATSALDSLTELAVMNAIYELSNQITIIAIAHRLSTVKNFDNIYLFKRGKIIASGAFKDLRRSNPQFDLMVEMT
jgi:ABC-type multidrug transport system fused ATPase/permease subunit